MYGKVRVEIPKTCRECRFFIQNPSYDCTAKYIFEPELRKWLKQNYAGARPSWCPIKEDKFWEGKVVMTRDEMIEFIAENPYIHITHDLFDVDEYIYSDIDGLVWDENGYLFENWDSITDMWSGANGLRMRTGGKWETGWHIKE